MRGSWMSAVVTEQKRRQQRNLKLRRRLGSHHTAKVQRRGKSSPLDS